MTRHILAIMLLLVSLAWAETGVNARTFVKVADTAEWTFYLDTANITNDNFYCNFPMGAKHKLYETEFIFFVEVQKRQNKYKTRDADKLAFNAPSYVPIPPGSIVEAAYNMANEKPRR